MQIVIVGSGYVGLVSGACLADFGHNVVCVDANAAKIDALKRGEMPIFEPGLEDLVAKNVAAGQLSFTTDLENTLGLCDVVFIAVGTPARRGDGHADLSHVFEVGRQIAPLLRGFTIVATKSTVPVGTGDELERVIREANPAADCAVVSNPEFLREGAAIKDFTHPDRIVVGIEDERARARMEEVYRPVFLNQSPILFTSRRTSELVKYAANAFLAMKITFINEIADLCETVDADVQQVARGIGLDNRIGAKFLHAGPGYGGSCFPKDTLALVKTAQDAGVSLRLVEATVAANDIRKRAVARKVISAVGGDVRGLTIGMLGLTFKPGTDDMREAPSLAIAQALLDSGAKIRAFDPEGMEAARALLPEITYVTNPYDVATDASAVVIVTEWNIFRALDLRRLRQAMVLPTLVDLRNIYNPDDVADAGLFYVSIGRPVAGSWPALQQAAE